MVSLTCISLDLIVRVSMNSYKINIWNQIQIFFFFFSFIVMEKLGDKPYLAINLHIS